ncbi:hypothetical protein BJI48_03005 [Helicobacter sp. 11S02596-1]|nr:hypothetical protein BJI48_03005 [Helicobacter sp. 11S02596-1]
MRPYFRNGAGFYPAQWSSDSQCKSSKKQYFLVSRLFIFFIMQGAGFYLRSVARPLATIGWVGQKPTARPLSGSDDRA